MAGILTKAKNEYVNFRGFHTKRHFVVIESDDWGSIRMPSKDTFVKLQKEGDFPQSDAFLSNDCLESEKDLNALFDVLSSVRDSKGRPAVMTANFAMANPDFDKIDYENGKYFYEPFYTTYDRYYPNNNILSLIKSGIQEKCFYPQLHCREHMNVNRWLKALKNKKPDAIKAFENKMIGIGGSFAEDNVFGYMDAFNTDCSSIQELKTILFEASEIFKNTFEFDSKSFVASCFVWNDELENALSKIGVLGIQSGIWQNVPVGVGGEYKLKRRIRYTGQKNKNGQIYTVRNCTYEPAYYQNADESADKCFEDVKTAFKNRKPAVINSHRFNYISSINPDNARNNLIGLEKLLNKITDNYDDVEFVSTEELIDIINKVKK